jgi:hypothetical protein
MPSDPRKRQKKLERRAAKRKEKKHLQVREQSAGLAERLSQATRFPILNCWISESLSPESGQGIGTVVISRALPNGQVAFANFLVDIYCLGVKDVFARIVPRIEFDTEYAKVHRQHPVRNVQPAEGRKLIEEAVAYARSIGLSPHPDYERAMILFGEVKASDSDAKFTFGKDGKPFYISGPNDTPERSRQIIAILTNTCGVGNFDFLVAVPPPGQLEMLEDEDFDEDEGEARWGE